MKIHSPGGTIEIIYPNQLVDLIPTSRIDRPIVEYYESSSLPTYNSVPYDPSYIKIIKEVDFFNEKEDFILKSLMNNLNCLSIIDHSNSGYSLEISLNDGVLDCLNNFGTPTHALLLGNCILVGEFNDPDTLAFKELAPTHGVLIVYRPIRFAIVRLDNYCPHISNRSKYNK